MLNSWCSLLLWIKGTGDVQKGFPWSHQVATYDKVTFNTTGNKHILSLSVLKLLMPTVIQVKYLMQDYFLLQNIFKLLNLIY